MAKPSHLELHDTDSEDLGIIDSVSLPSEPPDLRKWFSSYVYESPDLGDLDAFLDTDGKRETCIVEETTGEFGNDHPVSQFAEQVKSSQRIESNGSDDSECFETAATVPGLSESLLLSAEIPDLKNWFSSYTYESPPLDTALEFAISVCEEKKDDKFYGVKKNESQNVKDPMASIDVANKKLYALKNSSDAVVKGPNLVKCTKLVNESVCKDDEEEDVITLRPLLPQPSLSSLNKVSNLMLSGQKAGHSNHEYLEKIASTNAHGNDHDAILHNAFSGRHSISLNMETHLGSSQDETPVFRPIEGTDRVKDGLENEDIYNTVSPRTTDKIAPKRDSWESPGDRRSAEKENEEKKLLEDGFISIRKKSRRENVENMSRLGNGVEKTRIKNEKEKDTNMVRKVLSEISNFHAQNILGSTGKWSCPQKNKPDLGPPLKQLRIDQWVRRV